MNRLIIVAKLFGCLFGPLFIFAVADRITDAVTGTSSGGWQIARFLWPLLGLGVVWLGIVLVVNGKRENHCHVRRAADGKEGLQAPGGEKASPKS